MCVCVSVVRIGECPEGGTVWVPCDREKKKKLKKEKQNISRRTKRKKMNE